MGNAIIDFISQGGDLTSEEGTIIITGCAPQTIRGAVKKSQEAAKQLKRAREVSADVFLRRKILLAF